MNKLEKLFCEYFNISESQLLGNEPINKNFYLEGYDHPLPEAFGTKAIGGSVDLRGYDHPLPEAFGTNAIGGYVDLEGYDHPLPEAFGTKAIGGSVDLRGYDHPLPEAFGTNAIGGYVYLEGYDHPLPEAFGTKAIGGSVDLRGYDHPLPEAFNKENTNQNINFISWQNGKYIQVDDVFTEVISKRGKVWKVKKIAKDKEFYLVTDGEGKYSHGETIKEAKEDLIYKLSNRDKSVFEGMDLDKPMEFSKAVECYRVITGACYSQTKAFVEENNLNKDTYTINEILEVTKGAYESDTFARFFKAN